MGSYSSISDGFGGSRPRGGVAPKMTLRSATRESRLAPRAAGARRRAAATWPGWTTLAGRQRHRPVRADCPAIGEAAGGRDGSRIWWSDWAIRSIAAAGDGSAASRRAKRAAPRRASQPGVGT